MCAEADHDSVPRTTDALQGGESLQAAHYPSGPQIKPRMPLAAPSRPSPRYTPEHKKGMPMGIPSRCHKSAYLLPLPSGDFMYLKKSLSGRSTITSWPALKLFS